MFPTLQLGPLSLQTPGLMILLGMWFGLSLAEKRTDKHNINADTLYNLVFTALIAGLVGARLFYAASYLDAFTNPLDIISLNPSLLDPFGGIASGLLGGFIYAQRKKLSLWNTLDALTPFFAVGMIGLALSHIAAGTAFGMETNLPWGINLWGAKRHPTQFYELGAALLTLGLLWQTINGSSTRAGWLFTVFVGLTSTSWLLVEGFRGDSSLIPGGFRSGQIIAWLVLATALWKLDKLKSAHELN